MASTLADILARVRVRIKEASTDFWSDDSIEDYIYETLAMMYPRLYIGQTSTDRTIADGVNVVTLPQDIAQDSPSIDLNAHNLYQIEIYCPYLEERFIVPPGSYKITETQVIFNSNNQTGAERVVYMHYRGRFTVTTIPFEYEGIVVLGAAGRAIEDRIGRRITFDEINAAADITSATTGDLIGAAGYFMFQFNKAVDAAVKLQDIVVEEPSKGYSGGR